jgi:putative oxygen-independent coproporphyrinogen III oxidase
MTALQQPPLALYVHMPWCVAKCPYCDFNSHVHKGALPQASYIDALLKDLELEATTVPHREISSIFFGGGTPSLFSAESLATLMAGIRARVPIADDVEVTLEANPGTVEHGRFAGYRDAGINRISLGAQSFGARQLQLLGRIHDAGDTAMAVDEVVAAGLSNFNLDLMYALPEQSVEAAEHDIDTALALGPPHVSHYQLTLEPGTVFHSRPPHLPDEDVSATIEEATHARLEAAGYFRYEISAWALPGAMCRHNRNYWRFGDYLGIGAGAHGKRTHPEADLIIRTEKPKGPREYMGAVQAGSVIGLVRDVPRVRRPFEYFLNVLRLTEGFTLGEFSARTGLAEDSVALPITDALKRGLLEGSGSEFRPSARGLRFLNDLQAIFLDPA